MVRSFVIAVSGLTLPFVIRFFVIKGIATATEVSTVGVIYTAALGLFVYREFDWRRLYPILIETVSLTGAVMMIIGTATAMAWAKDQVCMTLRCQRGVRRELDSTAAATACGSPASNTDYLKASHASGHPAREAFSAARAVFDRVDSAK
jgi:hypothetical protein